MKLWKLTDLAVSSHLMLIVASSLTLLIFACTSIVASQLSPDFYHSSCPQTEGVVSAAVRAAHALNPPVLPKLLRLFFHDCFVEGCDASVLLDSTQNNAAEKSDPANLSLGGFNLIDAIKRTLEILCPITVSCADILVLAARDAVIHMGGPSVQIATGRKDGLVSLASNVRSNLPDTTFSLDKLNMLFKNKGMSQQDLVVLSGAHTVGVAHCNAFNDRFSFSSNGTVASIDSSLDPSFAQKLLARCPSKPNPSTVISNDQITPTVFDNAYYLGVQARRGLFHSDEVLLMDGKTRDLVNTFATAKSSFFTHWAESFRKLSTVGVKTGSDGEIRKHCRSSNSS